MASVPSRTFTDFSTLRVVIEKVAERRLGIESPNPPTAWKWDMRHMIGDNICETLPFPGLKSNHLLSIPREFWQNGPIAGRVGTSLKVENITEVFSRGRKRWVPVIHNGDLSIWRNSTFFFSDDSVVETLNPTTIFTTGRSAHLLQRPLRTGSPIEVNIYRRDRENEYLPWRKYSHRFTFSGLLDDDGNELVTRDGDTFYWDNVDTTKREFVSFIKEENIYLVFSQNVVEEITSLYTPSILENFNDFEYLGSTDGLDNQKFKTSRFPIVNDSDLKVYVVNVSAGTWETYSIVESFTASNQVLLDTDLGIITFGSDGTVNPPPAENRGIYIAYKAVPRIEYEEEGYRETSLATEADVSPLSQNLNRGFVTLSRTDLDIASIELTTNKNVYSGLSNVFGPVYVGADYASLFATVKSSSGKVVPNAEVTFYFETDPPFGGIGGSSTSVQRRTGFNGIANSFYIPPTSLEELGFYLTTVDPGNILTLPSNAMYSSLHDIYTYYVLKDDPVIGIPGADTVLGEIEWSDTELNGRKTIAYKWDGSAIHPISGGIGAYVPIRPISISGGNVLTYSDILPSPDSSSYGTVHSLASITWSSLTKTTDTAMVWTTNELRNCVVYSSSLLEYRRVASNTIDTITIAGSWSDIPTGNLIVYNKTINLGAYWVISDRLLTLRASVYSPKLGRTLYSNLLTFRVEIPIYMKGSYISDSLGEIPFGWRIPDGSEDPASAIDGATYISINPVAGPYPIIDVIAGETWLPYSGPITMDPEPFWPYSYGHEEGVSNPFGRFGLYWEII